VIKARVVRRDSSGPSGPRDHLDYIQRDGVEKDGSPGRLYSATGGDVRASLVTEVASERHQFRFIVSPEDGHELDLNVFTRDLMAQVERDTGRRLVWGAVNHHDTDNPHVHIVVRGVDAAGAEVRIERAYIAERMRWQAQHLVTRELGHRTGLDVARQRAREVGQERFTTLDRRLAHLMSPDGFIDVRRLALTTDRASRATLIARLGTLTHLGVAVKAAAASWQLLDGWEKALRALGERADIIKRLHAALGGPRAPGQLSVHDGLSSDGPVEGIVRRKGLHDELKGDLYAVVETQRGRAHYVRLDPATAESVREGQLVRVENARRHWAKPMDRAIEAVARQAGGTYDPRVHRAQLAARKVSIGGRQLEPEAVIEANLRRLERLERHRLVAHRPDGTWAVPANLVELLAERERAQPRFRTTVTVLSDRPLDEIRQLRPTWIDDQAVSDPTRAPFGFGAEVSAAARERVAFLRERGIAGSPDERRRELARQVRESLGADLAAALGGTYVVDPAQGFRGRVLPCECPPGSPRLLQVLDEPGRRLMVVAAADLPAGLEGQVIELNRDQNGRLVARRPGISRGD
jgi:type IV secretory pathway VirD2 relaxase